MYTYFNLVVNKQNTKVEINKNYIKLNSHLALNSSWEQDTECANINSDAISMSRQLWIIKATYVEKNILL